MPLRKLQEIIVDYAEHLYAEGKFRAVSSSIEYPYNGPAFAFKRNGKCLDLIDNTQELFALPDGEEIMAPINHRDFREPKTNQVRAAFFKFHYWENKIHKIWEDDHMTYPEKLQRELEIITGKLLPFAIEILKPAAESYALLEIDADRGQEYWTYTPCDLKCRLGALESGEDVPAEIQVKIEEFNDLLREAENHIRDIKEQESRSGLSKPQCTANGIIRLLQEIVVDYTAEIDTRQREFAAKMHVAYPNPGPLFTFAIEKGRLTLTEPKEDPVRETVIVSKEDGRVFRLRGFEGNFYRPRFRELTATLLKFAFYQKEAEKDEDSGGILLIRDNLFALTAQLIGQIADSYGFSKEFQGDIQEYPVCSRVQLIDGKLCADEDLPPALSLKVEEANFLKNKLLRQAATADLRQSPDTQVLLQKQIFVPTNPTLRSSFGDLAVARPKREDAEQSMIPPERGVRHNVVNDSAVIDDSNVASIREQRKAKPEMTPELSERSDHPAKRARSRISKKEKDPIAAERETAIQAYRDEVFEKTGKRITQTSIWKSAGYKHRAEYERWKRNHPRATRTADERFTRLLKNKPHIK